MGLRTKFNLAFLLASLAGLSLAGFISHSMLHGNAREEVLQSVRIMMESATAVRAYTVGEIKPLLVIQQTRKFIPQTVPAYAASKYVNRFQQKHPEYSYKEAVLNPTNPDNKATDWEADIVSWFSSNPGAEELVGERETAAGRQLYLGRPITIKNPDCLSCHETPEKAPRTMVDVYGPNNGFGWHVGETIGTQLVSVPMSIPISRADNAFQTFMITLCGIFFALFVLLNMMLHFWVLPSAKTKSELA